MKSPGNHIAWTDDDLTALATITHADLDTARAWWRKNALPRDRALLDGTTPADDRRCKAALYTVLKRSEQACAALTDQLRSGAIDTAGWQLGMAAELKNGHVCGVAAGRGGFAFIRLEDLR